MDLTKQIIVGFFLLTSSFSYAQDTNIFEKYEYKSFDERIDFLDSIFTNDYANNLFDVFYCLDDLYSISGVDMNTDKVASIDGNDSRMFLANKELYDLYIKQLRLFAVKLKEINMEDWSYPTDNLKKE